MKKKVLLGLVWFILGTVGLNAQVTIGSGEAPNEGALLDLKESDSDESNSKRGLLYPRVQLSVINELYPMYGTESADETNDYKTQRADIKKSHTGLIVYNITDNTGGFAPGLHIWDGEQWRKIDNSALIAPAISDLLCGSATMTPNKYESGTPFEAIIRVPYTGGNGGSYGSTAPSTPLVNGLAIERIAGKLNIGGGEVMYRVTGTPLASSPATTTFPITFLSKTCEVKVGNDVTYKVMEYVRNTIDLAGDMTSVSETTIGHLRIRLNNVDTDPEGSTVPFIQFTPTIDTHMLYLYEKNGAGNTDANYLFRYGQVAATAGNWYHFKDGLNPAGKTNSNINPIARDIATATFVLQHNDYREVYRATFNIYGDVPANGSVPSANGAVTIFIEKLD